LGRVGGRVAEALAQWAGGRPFWFFARAGRVGVEIMSSKTGWAWVGARTRPALSEVLVNDISRHKPPDGQPAKCLVYIFRTEESYSPCF